MSTLTHVPTHEPFIGSLPAHTTLREIAVRANAKSAKQTQWDRDKQYARDFVTKLQLEGVSYIPRRELSQIWGCLFCATARGWGYNQPDDANTRPLLNCAHCAIPTRHGFLGVIGRTL